KPLAQTLVKQLELIVDDPVVRGRIEVGTVDSVAFGVVSRYRGRPNIVSKDLLDSFWHDAAEKLQYSPVFLAREWEQVILAQNVSTEDAYLACSRSGRGVALSKAQRAVVWQAIATVVDRLAESGTSTFHQLAAEAALLTAGTPEYEHILVDEAQDLHPNQWRLLRALVPDGPDDLFIVGDPHQRIYDSNVSLKRLEIKVHGGRSTRLKLNYRTTQEILNWAIPVLGLTSPTGLDDAPDTLTGYRSPLHGRRPGVTRFADREAELDGLVRQVRRWLDDGIEPDSIGVTARRKYLVSEASKRLNAEKIKTFQAPSRSMGVQVGTMHSMKGLEFRCVAVIGVEDEMVPLRSAVTPEDEDAKAHGQDLQKERCLLFVACTRTRDHLYVSHVGAPSPFLPS
ncbi:MAG: helicase, partial [Gemmatimonadales bacterium]|nr:helicase [Gemmatimonadales bacterium]